MDTAGLREDPSIAIGTAGARSTTPRCTGKAAPTVAQDISGSLVKVLDSTSEALRRPHL